jgi:predicted HTH domain antitoxin
MTTVTVEIPEELLDHFDSLDEVRRTVYEDFIIEQRQKGNISLGRAAELLGVTYTEFFDLLSQKGLSFINAAKNELDQ